MLQRRILMVQKDIQTARYSRLLLEKAGHPIDWRPAIEGIAAHRKSKSTAAPCAIIW